MAKADIMHARIIQKHTHQAMIYAVELVNLAIDLELPASAQWDLKH
jgi:hypothetical protein